MHLRRARRLHNGSGLSRKDAAKISGVPAHTIRRFENATELPLPVQVLLRLARTFNLPMEALVPQEIHDEVAGEIARNRAEHELGSGAQ